MVIASNKVYLELAINSDVIDLVFPDKATGSIRPGSLNHLTKLFTIRWGNNMASLIEPGTIPPQCKALLLPANYKHPYETSMYRSGLWVYIHESNLECAPTNFRAFNVWKETRNISTPGFSWNYERPRRSCFRNAFMVEIQRKDEIMNGLVSTRTPDVQVIAAHTCVPECSPTLIHLMT